MPVFYIYLKVHRNLYSHRPAVELLLFDHLLGPSVTASRSVLKNKREAIVDALFQKIG